MRPDIPSTKTHFNSRFIYDIIPQSDKLKNALFWYHAFKSSDAVFKKYCESQTLL